MKILKKLIWLANRFSVMSKREVLHRIGELFKIYIAQLSFDNKAKKAQCSMTNYLEFDNVKSYKKFSENCDWQGVLADKEMLLANCYKVQSFDWKYETADSWLQCPETGFIWSNKFFTKINYREGEKHGDVRQVWEASRLQQLTALAYIASVDPSSTNTALNNYYLQFNSWFENNKPYYGPHYISVMECALRVISVCFSSSLIENKIKDKTQWLKLSNLITSHAEIIIERLSLHSSSGNHTLTEASALIFAGVFCAKHPRASVWFNVGSTLFIKEFLRQTNPDGSGIEQTSWYLKFIYELAVTTLPMMDKSEQEKIKKRVCSVEQFLADISVKGQIISFGDSDNGYAVSRYLSFTKKEVSAGDGHFHYEDTGLIRVQQSDTVIFFDCGNLGMKPGFGHGHADALSIQIFYQNAPVLCETGTGTYNGDNEQRRYFRSTAAHNTLVINRQDQSEQSSRFMWKTDIKAELLQLDTKENGIYILARHFGYAERFGCIHYRGVFVSVKGGVYVWDYVDGTAENIETYWHFPQGSDLNSKVLIKEDNTLTVKGLDKNIERYDNRLDIPSGLLSPSYGIVEGCITLKQDITSAKSGIIYFGMESETEKSILEIKSYFSRLLQTNGVK
jgi:hypothetical protein